MNESSTSAVDLIELLDRAERRIAALEARLARMESGAASTDLSVAAASRPTVMMEEVSSRRGLFKVAGAVATAAVAHSLVSTSPAAATAVNQGASGTANVLGLNVLETTTLVTGVNMTQSGGGGAAFQATNLATNGAGDGLKGVADNSLGAGVTGTSVNGYGVYGVTTNGYAVYANGRVGIGQHLASAGAPTSGSYDLGDIVRDNVGNIYACVVAGLAPSAAAFRKVCGPGTAGQLHLLAAPLRAYDSRPGGGGATGADGAIVSGAARVVSLAQGRLNGSGALPAIPAGSTGALLTVTLTETTGGGYLAVYSNALANWPGNSSLNWYANGQVLANTVVSAIDSSQRIKVLSGGPSTQFIIDVVGYYA